MTDNLSTTGSEFLTHLKIIEQDPQYAAIGSIEKIHVSGIGRGLYVAYEHLRNAAEYSEEHLLLRRAIERFYRRTRLFHDQRAKLDRIGTELIEELTQAGYFFNDSLPVAVIPQLTQSLEWHMQLFWQARKQRGVSAERAVTWVAESLSVEQERILRPRYKNEVFVGFAYGHFLQAIRREDFEEISDRWTYTMSVYCAVQRTLMKADLATVRYWLLRVSGRDYNELQEFIALNVAAETLFHARPTTRLMRLIRRHAAPFRILGDVVRNNNDASELLADRRRTLEAVSQETQRGYNQIRARLRRGIIRSIIFIFITKMLLGLGIEVPYDLARNGAIAWVPLLANLLFPPLYMATLGWGIKLPSSGNVTAIATRIDTILYSSVALEYGIKKRVTSPALNLIFNFVYVGMFLFSFGLLIWALHSLHFGMLQGLIFFVFLSTVSFLGFRLSQGAHELDLVDPSQDALNIASDFLYTPFVRTGQWIADKYSRMNVITLFLDMAIELPLKSFLRILQQWVGFLRDKREEI